MRYNWKGDALAKLWSLLLVLALVANSGILIGFQMILNYPYQKSADVLAPYQDYNIIDQSVTPELSAWLLAAPGKENRLILTEKHFALNRHRLLLDEEVGRGFSASVKADLGRVSVRLEGESRIEGLSFRPNSIPLRISSFRLRIPLMFLVWNLALLVLEILVCYLIHKARNG